MMRRFLRGFSIGVLSVFLTAGLAWAQLSTAQLSGRVTDQSAAVLSRGHRYGDANGHRFTRSDVTDSNGSYVLSNLPPGPYRLEVSLSGFRSYVQTGIVLQVAGSPAINVVLSVGSLQESVTVEGAAPLVDVQSSGISDVVRNEEILALPLNGRNAVELVMMSGAAGAGDERTAAGSARRARGVGGRRTVLRSGVPARRRHAQQPTGQSEPPIPVPGCAAGVQRGNERMSAQHGMHSGAAVNAVTKSGTNRFSGNAFEFVRDRRFNATNPFAQTGPDGQTGGRWPQAQPVRGHAGWTTRAEPAVLLSARSRAPRSASSRPPTSRLCRRRRCWPATSRHSPRPPATADGRLTLRGGFENNRVNPAQLSPAALNMTRRLPTTTDPCGQVTYSQAKDSNELQYVGRIDYQRTSNHTIFGRYMATSATSPIPMREGIRSCPCSTPRTTPACSAWMPWPIRWRSATRACSARTP
jgi:hypothetical protein